MDITPEEPVVLRGQFHARVSEGVMDPVTATALALQSISNGAAQDWAIMVSCDLVSISDELRDEVRQHLRSRLPDLDPMKVAFMATHTHSAPDVGGRTQDADAALAHQWGWPIAPEWANWGIELEAMSGPAYLEFAAQRITEAIVQAWRNRQPGGIGFGLGHAVVGHNRLVAHDSGRSSMYGRTDRHDFSHIEGYEDHAVNLLYTWDDRKKLTGVVINVACPSQVSEHIYEVSADFWHDTRVELRRRLGEHLFVLPQTAAAGDQAPHLIGRHNRKENAEQRMERITGRNRRQEIAVRIADAVTSVLPHVENHVDWRPRFAHHVEQLELSRRMISAPDVEEALEESALWRGRYEEMRRALDENPELRLQPRWYTDITRAYRRSLRGARVQERFEQQQRQPRIPYEVHVMRLGDMSLATNPFELYLDFGVQIQQRSAAVQTFVVQLAGHGTYVPTQRSVAGGAYGAVPASTAIGPEGGRELVERTLEIIDRLFPKYRPEDIVGSVSCPPTWRVFIAEGLHAPAPPTTALQTLPDTITIAEQTLTAHTVTPTDDRFDFAELFGGTESGRTAYVFIPLTSETNQEATFGFGADWWLQAWINGAQILDTTATGNATWPPAVDDHLARASLRPGRNILAIRFISGSGSSVLTLAGPDRLREILLEW